MGSHLRFSQKKYFYFILFFSCISFKSLSQAQNQEFLLTSLKSGSNIQMIDENYLQMEADVLYLKSEMAYYNHQNSEAIAYLKAAILQAPQSSHLKIRLAEIYQKENLLAEAAQQYETLIKDHPHNLEVKQRLVKIESLRDLNEEALKRYENITSYQKNLIPSLLQKTLLLIEEKKWQDALTSLNQASQQASTSEQQVEILISKAYIYNELSKKLEEKKVYKQLLKLNIPNESLVLKISNLYLITKQFDRALQLLLKYQKKEETSALIAKTLFDLYMHLNLTEKAQEQLLHLRDLKELESSHYFFMVSFLISKNKYREALPFIRDLIQDHPQKDYYRYLLGITHEESSELQLAFKEYKKIKKITSIQGVQILNPYFLPAQIQMGQILRDQGRISEALRLLKPLAFMKNTKEIKPLLLYAQYLWEQGSKQQALVALTKGANLFPQETDVLFLRGLYLEKLNQMDASLKDMEKILQINAAHEEALNFLAYNYARQDHHLERAKELALKAVSLNPSSSYFLDTLGWVFFKQGAYKQALVYLTKAFSQNKEDSHIAKHLGETYFQLKNFEKCEYFFKQALELETNEKEQADIQKRLALLPAST